ncbi:MAG: hypothetical protein ACREBW_02625, partial [Candidatus Micrarchaeaceae archaeon]
MQMVLATNRQQNAQNRETGVYTEKIFEKFPGVQEASRKLDATEGGKRFGEWAVRNEQRYHTCSAETAKVVIAMMQTGLDAETVKEHTGVSVSTTYRWLRRAENTGIHVVHRRYLCQGQTSILRKYSMLRDNKVSVEEAAYRSGLDIDAARNCERYR